MPVLRGFHTVLSVYCDFYAVFVSFVVKKKHDFNEELVSDIIYDDLFFRFHIISKTGKEAQNG